MKLKTFREFIKENFRTALIRKGLIKKDFIKDEIEINFYFEKLDKIDLESYMATFDFKKNEIANSLSIAIYGKPKYLRFLLYYHENYYYMFVFHGEISHFNFISMLDKSKTKYTTINDHKQLYNFTKKGVINSSIDITKLWCFPGVYNKEVIECWASNKYLQHFTDLKLYEKLGYDKNTWLSKLKENYET